VEIPLSILQIFVSILLIFLVLMHSGKDAGLSGAFGVGQGGSAGSTVERNLNRWTVAVALVFAINTLVLVKVG
jgi:preprotein translocase subunit SecG